MNIPPANYPNAAWDGITPNREGKNYDFSPDQQDYEQIVSEIVALQKPVSVGAAAGVGVSASDISGQIVKTTITITNLELTITDAGVAGAHGSQKLYDLPAGNILVLGAVGELSLVAGSGGLADTAAVVASIGTAAVGTGDATLTGTEADIVPSTAATLSAGAGTANMANTSTLIKDGTDTPVDAFLNVAVPDAGSTANDTLTVNGTLTISWVNLGDN